MTLGCGSLYSAFGACGNQTGGNLGRSQVVEFVIANMFRVPLKLLMGFGRSERRFAVARITCLRDSASWDTYFQS